MITSQIQVFWDELTDLLKARPGLAGVTVASGDLADDDPDDQVLLLHSINDGDQEWSATGNLRRTERYSISYTLWAVEQGAGEDVIRAARLRAFEIHAELEQQLREDPHVNRTCTVAEVKPNTVHNIVTPTGRGCEITGVVAARTELSLT